MAEEKLYKVLLLADRCKINNLDLDNNGTNYILTCTGGGKTFAFTGKTKEELYDNAIRGFKRDSE